MRSTLSLKRLKCTLLSSLLLTLSFFAQDSQAQHLYSPLPAQPDFQAQRLPHQIPVKSGLAAYDDSPLGTRMPVVLIHGIGATASTQFNWENFLDFARKEADFNAKYKLYLYHYDSSRSVPDISNNLQTTLKTFIGELNSKPIKIVAYSEGGLLTRNALQDDALNEHVQEVITIATPFHGSPLANPEWVKEQLKTESRFSLVRMGQGIAYKITGKLYPTFKEDFHWDNFDGALPSTLSTHTALQSNLNPVTSYKLASKIHFVTYGSYFGMEIDQSLLPSALGIEATLPPEKPIVGNLFRRNLLFSIVRHTISKLPMAVRKSNPLSSAQGPSSVTNVPLKTASLTPDLHGSVTNVQLEPTALNPPKRVQTPTVLATSNPAKVTAVVEVQKESPLSMMMFNDGISPISSTLWLGRYLPQKAGTSVSVDKLWDTLKKLKGKNNVRLFAGLDHRNWMDGTTRTHTEAVQDLLNPEEGAKSIFAWIVYDLMS